jgi:excisionase family DNA binding protein
VIDHSAVRLAAVPGSDEGTPLADPIARVCEPLLLTADQAAELLGVSTASLYRMQARGRLPKPHRLSPGCVRYSRETLVEWVRMGCPPLKEFEARKAAGGGR